MAISTTNTTAKNTPTPIYWRLRYALAPLLTAFDIFSISGVPCGLLFHPREHDGGEPQGHKAAQRRQKH